MTFERGLQRDGVFFAFADARQGALGQVETSELVQMFEDGFADVVCLGAPGSVQQFFQAIFDGPVEAGWLT